MKTLIQSTVIVILVLQFTSANAQQFGIKSQHNWVNTLNIMTYSPSNLAEFIVTPTHDHKPQWLFYRFNKHQIDVSYLNFKNTLDQNWGLNNSGNNREGQNYNINQFNLRYNYYFKQGTVQPYAFSSILVEKLKNTFYRDFPDNGNGYYSYNFHNASGIVSQLNFGTGVLFQKANFGFYAQVSLPILTLGKVKRIDLTDEKYSYVDANDNLVVSSTYRLDKQIFSKLKAINSFDINPQIFQVGFQYQLASTAPKEQSIENQKANTISLSIGGAVMGINYAFESYYLSLNVYDKYQLSYFRGQSRIISPILSIQKPKIQESLVFAKVLHLDKFRLAGGFGARIIDGKFNTILPLLYADASYVIKNDVRIGFICSKGFFANNFTGNNDIYTVSPIALYAQLPIFSTNWLKKKE